MKDLISIQAELKAPKGQFNSFGKYNYRSAEDILEAVKPLLNKYGALLTLSDEIKEVGGRIYVQATATFTASTGNAHTVTAFAREADEKKGMDESQITGTASSYARKYALNGLFLIDDTKDADTDAYSQQTQEKPKTASKASKEKIEVIKNLINQTNSNTAKLCEFFKVKSVNELTQEQAEKCIKMLESKIGG